MGLVLLTAAVLGAAWCGRAVPLVRWAAIVYGVVAVGAFVIKSPLGGNVVRLGWLVRRADRRARLSARIVAC